MSKLFLPSFFQVENSLNKVPDLLKFDKAEIIITLLIVPMRFLIIASIFYFIFYKIMKNKWIHLKIQTAFPTNTQLISEILYSVSTMLIFSFMVILVLYLNQIGYTKIYFNIGDYGIIYFISSLVLIMLIHDLYFYLSHRMMHNERIFPIVHSVHHRSINPTPWTAFSIHPIEAFIQLAWVPIIIMLLPIHYYVLMIWSFNMTIFNIIGHLGFEIFPKQLMNYRFGKFIFSSTFHNLHHSKVNCNYGLYLIIWDILLKTLHDNYKDYYNQIKLDP
jgi:sterol desaturase/sphingolipid hydroxylase (fatty acid hydroxylase superfamily)